MWSGSTPCCGGRVFLEQGYGERFGVSDEQLAPLVAELRPREQVLAESDIVLLPKPTLTDLDGAAQRSGGVGLAALRPGCGVDPAVRSTAG